MDRYAAARERQRHPPGADTELERPSGAGELGQQIDHRIDDVVGELIRVGLVVPGRKLLVEVAVILHGI